MLVVWVKDVRFDSRQDKESFSAPNCPDRLMAHSATYSFGPEGIFFPRG